MKYKILRESTHYKVAQLSEFLQTENNYVVSLRIKKRVLKKKKKKKEKSVTGILQVPPPLLPSIHYPLKGSRYPDFLHNRNICPFSLFL